MGVIIIWHTVDVLPCLYLVLLLMKNIPSLCQLHLIIHLHLHLSHLADALIQRDLQILVLGLNVEPRQWRWILSQGM
jgi:hypothetical protein